MHLSEYALEKILTGAPANPNQVQSNLAHLKQCDRCASYVLNSQDMVTDFTHSYPSFSLLQKKYQSASTSEPDNYYYHFQCGFFATGPQFKELKQLIKAVCGLFYMLQRTQRPLEHTPY